MQILVVQLPARPPLSLERIARQGWQVATATSYRDAIRLAGQGEVDAVVLPAPSYDDGTERLAEFETLVRVLDSHRIAGVVVGRGGQAGRIEDLSLLDDVDEVISADEIRGRLAMIERYHGVIEGLERELANMQRLGQRLNRHFHEVDQELRLAGRLQHDFLPKLTEPIGNLRFASVYRPAAWVSGDIFNVRRIDEDHTAFYVADAVGHGLAAGLLTMFINRAILPTRNEGGRCRVLDPSEVMAALNRALAEQDLPNCQFVTAAYFVIDHRTMMLRYARGGHPYPVLLGRDGVMAELKASGGLLGVFEDAGFSTFETRLHPGDRLLVYTDGVELALPSDGSSESGGNPLRGLVGDELTLSVGDLLAGIERRLDEAPGSLEPKDDVTILGVEVLEGGPSTSRAARSRRSGLAATSGLPK